MSRDNQSDSTAWYQDPGHPLYLSDNAIEKRRKAEAAREQARKTRRETTEAKKIVEQRLGKELSDKVVERLLSLVSCWDYGIGLPRHQNGSSIEFPRKLRKADLYKHLAETDASKRIYYTTNPLLINETRLCMLTIDIDTQDHDAEDKNNAAQSVESDLREKLDRYSVAYLSQRSTNGAGFHVTLLVSLPDLYTQRGIRDQLVSLRYALSDLYESSSCSEVCLKGLNQLRESKQTVLYGTLVKLPQLRSKSVAESFIAMTEAPVAAQELSRILRSAKNNSLGTDKKKANNNDTLNTTRGTNRVCLQPEGVDNKVHATASGPKGRMWEAIKDYQKRHLKNPSSIEELISHYESLGFHTGKGNEKRYLRAREVWEYAQANYKPPAPLPSINDWHAYLEPILKLKGVDLEYTKGRRIKPIEAAIFGYLLSTKLELLKSEEIPTSYIKNGSTALKENGQTSTALNCNKKVAKLFRVFLGLGIVQKTREFKKGKDGEQGICRAYVKGPSWIRRKPYEAESRTRNETADKRGTAQEDEQQQAANREANRVSSRPRVAIRAPRVHRQPPDSRRSDQGTSRGRPGEFAYITNPEL